MKVNPQEFSWNAPTTNVDGDPIDYPLAYTLGARTVETDPFTEIVSFPGTLNADGKYEVQTAQLQLPRGRFSVALLAFPQDVPELKSDWSNSVEVFVGAEPEAPFGLAAE